MATCLIALGSNLGDSSTILERAIERLDREPTIAVVQRSRWFHTAPVGGPAGQAEFVNAAIRVETSLSAQQLHARLREVETQLGRERRQRWAARSVDLDLLLFDDRVLGSDRLTIPHPRMAFRRFVLEPAAEVAGDMRHPLIGWTVRQLLEHLNRSADYLALTGSPGTGKTDLARAVSEAAAWRRIEDPAAGQLPADCPETEILQRRASVLARATWPPDTGAVSAFWIGQSLVDARLRPGGGADEVDRLWSSVCERVVPPKLLVWLVRPEDADATLWQEVLQRYHRGPLLKLDAARPRWAMAEVTAAVQAMQ